MNSCRRLALRPLHQKLLLLVTFAKLFVANKVGPGTRAWKCLSWIVRLLVEQEDQETVPDRWGQACESQARNFLQRSILNIKNLHKVVRTGNAFALAGLGGV